MGAHIKNFKQFYALDEAMTLVNTVNSRYLTLNEYENSLVLTLTPEGKQELVELVDNNDGNAAYSETQFNSVFDDVQLNSEYVYYTNLGDAGYGLTDAPGIVIGDDVFYYNNYAMKSFIEDLLEKNTTIFNKA